MILKFSEKLLGELRKVLSKECAKSVAVDIWSDHSKSTYLGATIYTVDEKFECNNYFLGLHLMENGTTNQRVREAVAALLDRVGLSMDSIDFFVTDNGTNMIACFKEEAKGKFIKF